MLEKQDIKEQDIGLVFNDADGNQRVVSGEIFEEMPQFPALCPYCGELLDLITFDGEEGYPDIGLTCSCDGWIEFKNALFNEGGE